MSLCPETGNENPLFVVLAHALIHNWTGNAALTGCGWLKPAKRRHYVMDEL